MPHEFEEIRSRERISPPVMTSWGGGYPNPMSSLKRAVASVVLSSRWSRRAAASARHCLHAKSQARVSSQTITHSFFGSLPLWLTGQKALR